MSVIFYEADDSRRSVGSAERPSYELRFTGVGTTDDLEVHAAVRANLGTVLPLNFYGLVFQEYDIDSQGGDVWDLRVTYGLLTRHQQQGHVQGTPGDRIAGPEQTGFSLTFDTTGGQQKVTQALQTRGRYAPAGKVAPDHHGAINVTETSIEGVEITVPALKWAETYPVPVVLVTFNYIRTLYTLTGRLNYQPFRGLASGEVLFLGCSGSRRDFNNYELTYHFVGSADEANFQVAGDTIDIPFKGGHDYLWLRFRDTPDPGSLAPVKRPIAAYVEQVYKFADFSQLGIGTA
jgi:hypothetical protein